MATPAERAPKEPVRPQEEGAEVSTAPLAEVAWPDIVRLIDQHPRLAAGSHQVDAARGGVRAASAVPNPTLEGNIGQGVARTGGARRVEWGLALTVPLGWIAQRGSRIGAAEAEVDEALAESMVMRRDVVLQLRTLFWTLVSEQSRVASLEALAAQTACLVETVRKRVEKGDVRPVEAIRVEIELEKIRSELEAARISRSARQAELALWLGLPAPETLAATADLEALPVALDRDAAVAKVRGMHPALTVARARARFSEAEAGAERMARIPSFGLTGFVTDELDRRAFGVGLTIDVPLWDWNSGRIAQAEARLSSSREQARAVGLEVEATVLDGQAACHASVLTATRFKNSVVPRSEAAARTMERTYQLGEASLLEVIDARRTLLDSRRLYLNALTRAQLDCSRLSALVGEDPE